MPSREELKQLQALPLEIKIRKTQQRIREWVEYYGEDGVYVSFSGGKDSTVLLDIVRKMYPGIEAVFVNTGLEYPEIVDFVKQHENVTILRPKKNFRQVLAEYGYPVISKNVSHNTGIAVRNPYGSVMRNIFSPAKKGKYALYKYLYLTKAPFKVSGKCCDIMKKEPAATFEKQTGKKAIIATMAQESVMRSDKWLKYGCNAFGLKRPQSTPLSFWTNNDILAYIRMENLPIAEVYGDVVLENEGENEIPGQETTYDLLQDYQGCKFRTTGCDRTGCMYCLFGAHLEKGEGRLEKMKRTHPKRYEYVMGGGEFGEDGMWIPNSKGLGFKFVVDWLNEHGNLHIRY